MGERSVAPRKGEEKYQGPELEGREEKSWEGQGGDSGREVGTFTGKGAGWGWLVRVCPRG